MGVAKIAKACISDLNIYFPDALLDSHCSSLAILPCSQRAVYARTE